MAKSISNLSQEELDQLTDESFNEDISDDNQGKINELLGGEPVDTEQKPSEFVAEVEIEEPTNEEDNSNKPQSPTKPVDNSTTQNADNATTPQVSDELYNQIVEQYPSLAKFDKANILAELAKGYTNLESKLGSPERKDPPAPITDEQVKAKLNAEILETANSLMLKDGEIAKLLTVRDEDGNPIRLQLPQTEEEKFAMMDKYPARYQAIMERAKDIYSDVKTTLTDRTQKILEAPKVNEQRGLTFLKKVEDYFTKIYDKPTDDEKKEITDRVEQFFNNAIKSSRYFTTDNGVKFLDADIMFADFISQNVDVAVKLGRISALNNHTDKFTDTANKIQKKVSMKTLTNSQNSGGKQSRKFKVDLADPKSLGRVPNDVLNALIYEAEK